MAKHRTKSQKLKAAEHHRLQAPAQTGAEVELVAQSPKLSSQAFVKTGLQWTGGSTAPSSAATVAAMPAIEKTRLVFGFDPKWVYQDLRKTVLVSAVIVGILVFIYFLSF